MSGIRKIVTMGEFIVNNQSDYPKATGEFSRILSSIRLASKIVHREISKVGLLKDLVDETSNTNVHGEVQKGLDVYANNHFVEALRAKGEVCAVASEESKEIIVLKNKFSKKGKYIVLIDPLDGSSNINANAPVGTIFSIIKRISPVGSRPKKTDFLQPGNRQVASGYIIYGTSTMFVYTTGKQVNGFTLDNSIGVYFLSHPNMKIYTQGKSYSINEGNYNKFPKEIKTFIKYCQEEDKDSQRPYQARYIGSLVADFHRILINGGVFMYPNTAKHINGKLRILYECNPLAFIAKVAGGKASNGFKNILDVVPKDLHDCSPYYIGSIEMIKKIEYFFKKK